MRVKAHQLVSMATNVDPLTRKPQVLQQSYQILCWQRHAIHQCFCLYVPAHPRVWLRHPFWLCIAIKKKKTPKLVAPNNNLLHYLTVLRINWANLRVLTWGLSGSYSQMEADVLQSFTWAGCPRWAFHSCVWHLSRDGWSSWALGRHLSLSLSLHVDSLSELPAAWGTRAVGFLTWYLASPRMSTARDSDQCGSKASYDLV